MTPKGPWPELPWHEWDPTISTLHRWLQIVGKVRMALAPPLNHWWHVPLYVSSRGLTTSVVPYGHGGFQVDFDFVDHALTVTQSSPGSFTMPLAPKSVASFYQEFMHGLGSLGIEVRISTRPVEVDDSIAFDEDDRHASYDVRHVRSLWHALLQADRVMKSFQAGFVGEASPVHLFWGSFDLSATRYAGRGADSGQESSVGWWPAREAPGPAFYAYTSPEPAGFQAALVRPPGAGYDRRLGEFVFPYEAARQAPDPDAAVLDFFQSTFEAGVDLGGWDRPAVERSEVTTRSTRRAHGHGTRG